jgi:hypothetical protein
MGHLLVTKGVVPADLRVHQPTLEDAYLELVGQTPDGAAQPAEGNEPGELAS